MVIAMSYGKVDHDRYAYLVLLALLPTIGAARHGERETSEAVGFAVRSTQLAVVLTYFLSSWAKIRFGGWNWPTGAIFERAIVRRGTFLSNWLLHYPHVLEVGQFAMVAFELSSPLILLARSDRARYVVVAVMLGFHLMTFGALTIIFLPHLVAITASCRWNGSGRWSGAVARRPGRRSVADSDANARLALPGCVGRAQSCPAGAAGSSRGEHAGHRGGVDQVSGQHLAHRLVELDPLDRHVDSSSPCGM